MKYSVFALLLLLPLAVFAGSFFSSPEENFERIEQSLIMYKYGESIDSLGIINEKPVYQSNISISRYQEVNDDMLHQLYPAKINYDMAEAYFMMGDYKSALNSFELAYQNDPENYELLTYIAQCHRFNNEPKKAIELLDTYEKKYFHYYQLHLIKGLAYNDMKQYKKAKDALIYAHILNRNFKELNDILNETLDKLKKKQVDWTGYIKNYILVDSSEVHITVDVVDDSLSFRKYFFYNNCKALWLSDSLFVQSKDIDISIPFNKEIAMELDAYYNHIAGDYANDGEMSEIENKVYEKCLKKGTELDYLFYEKLLVDYPLLALNLDEKKIRSIHKYFNKYKITKK